MMKFYIKNMVCPRCILAVKSVFENYNIELAHIQLGEVITSEAVDDAAIVLVKADLEALGFELLDDENKKLIEQIKLIIIEQIHYKQDQHQTISDLLASRLHRDYSSLSKLFSATTGITIEQFTILQKIEKAKELLSYNELTLGEIAFRLGYSSVAHLSAQFKRITGLTPTQFKNQNKENRRFIDKLS
ncbi:AraC family transcriptional regulator [Dysgonomonas sp. PH5-45]|uniref:helix-turn-helix domain-containing protein n=1 Tax=unclassified Dysgonomonas TaxID=2630389 RepID=UPI0024732939|nr:MULTISPECIES: AraC family transcriptional regulator [unclassified Dysgonomonas]MDH6354014.1 AraC family transcriptional regulator [Dysgonomonas sp. PH5-45]MDH6386916.1 AraC family transcriptional regulator [Dysgonomonas sp. PH5-37]